MGPSSAERERAEALARRVTVGIVTALEEERAAMLTMLDRPVRWSAAGRGAGLESEGAIARAMALVNELGLVTLDEETGVVSLHRLVHRQVRRRAETEREDAWREASWRGAEAAAEWISGAVVVNQTRTEMEAVDTRREHLDQALDAANRVGHQGAWIAIADRLATHLRNRARNDEALVLFQQALTTAEQLVPPDPSRVATSLSNLALVLKDLGDAAGAKSLLERALTIVEIRLPPGHPYQRTIRENLAGLDAHGFAVSTTWRSET